MTQVNDPIQVPDETFRQQTNYFLGELKLSREKKTLAEQAWRTEEALNLGIRASWYEDRMNAALDELCDRYAATQ